MRFTVAGICENAKTKPKKNAAGVRNSVPGISYECIIIRHKNLKAKRLRFLWPFGVPLSLLRVFILLPSGYLKLFQGNRSRYSKDPGG